MRSNLWANIRKKIIKQKFFDIDQKIENGIRSNTRKILKDFNCIDSASIQLFAVKKIYNVKLARRFLSKKMLMFTKLSLMSFIYELVKTFYSINETVRKIYEKYLIDKVYICHILSDTDSTCLKLIFISSTDRNIRDRKF